MERRHWQELEMHARDRGGIVAALVVIERDREGAVMGCASCDRHENVGPHIHPQSKSSAVNLSP